MNNDVNNYEEIFAGLLKRKSLYNYNYLQIRTMLDRERKVHVL